MKTIFLKVLRIFMKITKYVFIVFICINLIFLVVPFFSKCNSNSGLEKYDVIIVLGIPANNNCKPGEIMKNRVEKGVALYKLGLAQKIIFTGSSVRNNCYEANVMAEYAIAIGVPKENIIKENKALNTFENAHYSVIKMKELNFTSAAIVTSQAHIKRSCAIFSKFNIDFTTFGASTQNTSTLQSIFWNMGEKMILTHHMIFGYPKIHVY